MSDSAARSFIGREQQSDLANRAEAPAFTSPPSLPVYTYDQIANQLVNGYWGGDAHHFDISSGAITVNLTALNAVGQLLAREALSYWSDIIGVHFVEVSSGGQITFDDADDGSNPHTSDVYSGGITTSASVNVPRSWLVSYGSTLDSYGFQSYVHEIGHALGLGHPGEYNTTANYPVDASYLNDSWATSVMSYFNQTENTYFAEQGFTYNIVVTPMAGDIAGMQLLYGLSTTTRTGNTVYGFNSNANRSIYDATQFPTVAYTIFDSGGTDTLDYSLTGFNQTIDLNPETFSSVLGSVGNVSIGRGVVIENAIGGAGSDTILGNDVANYLRGGAGDDVIEGHGGNDRLDGGTGADVMRGGAGNDTFYVDSTTDQVVEAAAEGTDTVITSATFTLGVNVERLTLTGSASITGRGNGLNNIIIGNSGANVIDGRAGTDSMSGGDGNDTYTVDNAGDSITETSTGGIDTVRSSISYTLGSNLENLVLTGLAANGTGNGLANHIYGNAAGNVLNGGTGADVMSGGDGNDTYYVDTGTDRVIETSATGGNDTVRSSASFVLGANIENLVLTGAAFRATGNDLPNYLYGTVGANILDGRGGADTMRGGGGNDTYYVDDAGDVVIEGSDAGYDTVQSSVTFVLSSNLEALVLTGSAAINATGNALDNRIIGNSGANIIDGGGGADVMNGGRGADTYIVDNAGDRVIDSNPGDGDSVLSSISYILPAYFALLRLTGTAFRATGNSVVNQLYGNAADNILDGRAGADTMFGGAGNDTYYVDNVGDVVGESANEGNDRVMSTVTFTLIDNIETLILTGTAAINGTGNGLANTLVGNDAPNVLDGGAGADRMQGNGGDDAYYVDNAGDRVIESTAGGYDTVNSAISFVLPAQVESLVLTADNMIDGTGNSLDNLLIGNGAHNILDGGAGADRMEGGRGADYYYVDNAGDVVVEDVNYGEFGAGDTIFTTVSYALPDNVERIQLLGTESINATGNSLDNIMTGNDGDNVLNGGAGADTMNGGAGNDTYFVDNTGDRVGDAAGIDTLMTTLGGNLPDSLENVVLLGTANLDAYGNAAANVMTGNAGANLLYGGAGNDTIDAGAGNDWLDGSVGNDTLTGGSGADTFRIYADLIPANVDTITDFSTQDTMLVSPMLVGLPEGGLPDSAFYIGSAAHDGSDRIVYDSATGNLYFDADGTGSIAPVLMAHLPTGLALTSADFLIGT